MKDPYYHTQESVDEYIQLSEGVNGSSLIQKLKSLLPEDSTVLEIGSGPGTDWQILNKTYQVTGSDNSIAFMNHLKAKNPEGLFLDLDAVTLKTDQTFDGIYSNKVMHHLKDDEFQHSIKRQSEILHSKGLVCHSFWKGEGSEIFKGLFVNYHTKESLEKAFTPYFEIIAINSYKEFDDGDSLLVIAKKK